LASEAMISAPRDSPTAIQMSDRGKLRGAEMLKGRIRAAA
jgi:hypothetical protein